MPAACQRHVAPPLTLRYDHMIIWQIVLLDGQLWQTVGNVLLHLFTTVGQILIQPHVHTISHINFFGEKFIGP